MDGTAYASVSPMSSSNGSTAHREPLQSTSAPVNHQRHNQGDLIQLANKSCTRCRERRVRCNREWPNCDRCLKRKEDCDWGPNISIETRERDAVPEATKIQQLEARLALAQSKLANANPSYNNSNHSPANSLPTSASPGLNTATNYYQPASSSPSNQSPTPPDVPTLVHQAMLTGATYEQSQAMATFLVDQATKMHSVGHHSLSNRLGASTLAEALVLHLIDASGLSSCSRLPAFRLVKARVDLLRGSRTTLVGLSSAEQVDVILICALGARASPHSALLGVPTLGLADGTAKSELYLTAGARRHQACRQLEEKAKSLSVELMLSPGVNSLETLVGMTQYSLMEESGIKPVKSRFYLRSAIGIYQDLQHGELQAEETTKMQQDLGKALWIEDAMVAAHLAKPTLVTATELAEYFAQTGVVLPKFDDSTLPGALEDLLDPRQGRPTKATFAEALELAGCWVCACQREFAMVCTGWSKELSKPVRRPDAPSVYDRFRQLWATIDVVHSGVQRLQQALVSATTLPGAEDDPEALDQFVIHGVRIDSWLVDLIWLQDSWLRTGPGAQASDEQDRRLLDGLRFESELRLRKCLRLTAFYAQLYLSSKDKHVVYHAMCQLDLVPNWTSIAVEKCGTVPGVGPSSPEFELTDQELDWLESGLTLASFYHPRPAQRLRELVNARARARPPPFPTSSPHDSNHISQANTYYNVPPASYPSPSQGFPGSSSQPGPGASQYPVTGGVNSPDGGFPSEVASPFPPNILHADFPAFNFDELGVVTNRAGRDEFGQAGGRGLLDLPLVNAGFGGGGGGGQPLGAQASQGSIGGGWMDWALDEAISGGAWGEGA